MAASSTSTSPSPPLLSLLRAPSSRHHHLPISSSHLPTRRLALEPSRPRVASLAGVGEAAVGVGGDGEQEEEEEEEEEELVEVGYVSGAHGVRGEVRVVPRTDFPELRFATPGKRWLRARAAGKGWIKEFELTGGRAHPGKKSWIVSLGGVNTVEEAKQIVGSAILIRAGDRPELQEDEIYSRDLVGMRVVLKDTGKLVGTVANVFNFGAGDLLQVMVDSAEGPVLRPNSANQDASSSGAHVWIPFVRAIVPDVDLERREMCITPPEGLLELNSRTDMRSKKERRLMEWKEKKKLQHRLIAAKKILSEMDQRHVLEGLRSGDKAQKASLAKQIASIDFQLFRHAMRSVSKLIDSSSDNTTANSSLSMKNVMRIPHKILTSHEEKEKHVFSGELDKGLEILRKSKAAVVLIRNDSSESDLAVDIELRKLLSCFSKLMEVEENHVTVPFIIIIPAGEVELVRNCLIENDYFGLDSQKVWVLAVVELPIVSISSQLKSNKILLKSPWEILQGPAGSGGIFSLLSSNKILDALNELGVEYLQICSLDNRSAAGHPLLFGAASSRGADVGVKLYKSSEAEGNLDMILSMNHLNRMSRDVNKLRFSALPEQHIHVEYTTNEWITVQPEAPNSYRLHTDVSSLFNSCSPDKVCVMEVVE